MKLHANAALTLKGRRGSNRLIPPEVATIDDGAVPEIGEERVSFDFGRETRNL